MTMFSVLSYTLILLVFIKFTIQADDDIQCPNTSPYASTLMKLKRQVACQYDKWIRPVKHQNDTVDVTIKILVTRIDFDEKSDILTVYTYFIVQWYDYHIVWKPSEFDNIDFMRVHSWYIWNPDLGILNSADQTGFKANLNTPHCLIYSDGDVTCVPPIKQTASCSANLRHWPYDVHTCSLTIGSWMHSGEELNLSIPETPVEFRNFSVNREWYVSDISAVHAITRYGRGFTYPYVTFKFLLERHSGSYAAIVVIPGGVLMLVTLMSYWMEPCHSDRIVFGALNIVSHFIFLQYLGYILPSNGDLTPVIVTFYRDSLILTLMAFLTTIVVRGLRSSSTPVPLWISGVSSWVLQSRIGQIIVLHKLDPKAVAASESSSGEGADLVSSSERFSKFGWDTFTTLLNFIIFIITIFTYFILLIGYLP